MGNTVGTVTTVFILDDHEIVRRGLTELINSQPDMRVIGEAATAHGAVRGVAQSTPDVAILDVRLGEGCGLDVCRQLRRSNPSVASMMLTSITDDRLLLAAHAAGAAALCLKSIRPADLIETIRTVAKGADLIGDRVVQHATHSLVDEADVGLAELSERERRMVELIGLGWSNRQIADELIFAEKTVKNYVSRLLSKLDMTRRAEVAALAGRMAEREAGWQALTNGERTAGKRTMVSL